MHNHTLSPTVVPRLQSCGFLHGLMYIFCNRHSLSLLRLSFPGESWYAISVWLSERYKSIVFATIKLALLVPRVMVAKFVWRALCVKSTTKLDNSYMSNLQSSNCYNIIAQLLLMHTHSPLTTCILYILPFHFGGRDSEGDRGPWDFKLPPFWHISPMQVYCSSLSIGRMHNYV